MWMRWITLATVTLLFGSTMVAAANDVCFLDDLGLPPLVVRDFSLPKAGECAGFSGSFQDGAFVASGLACGSTEVGNINFKANIDPPMVGETVRYSFFVNRETLTGEGAILCSPAECGVVFGIPFGSLLSFFYSPSGLPAEEAPRSLTTSAETARRDRHLTTDGATRSGCRHRSIAAPIECSRCHRDNDKGAQFSEDLRRHHLPERASPLGG